MPRPTRPDDSLTVSPPRGPRWRRWLVLIGGPAVLLVVLLCLLGALFLRHVPPGKMLVLTANDGGPLTDGEVLADPGQKGVQRRVLAEGWHLVTPIAYSSELA